MQQRQQRRAGPAGRVAGDDLAAPRSRGSRQLNGHSSVTPTHDGVQRGAAGDHVGDQAALGHRRDRLQVDEARLAEVHPVGPGAAVGDRVHAQLAARAPRSPT